LTSVELYREEGRHYRSVRVRLDADSFVIETQDMGPTTEEFWGDSDYEFWTTVPKAAWGDLLMALAEEFLNGDARATDRLRDICRKRGVRHEWASWK
jgi:hypothetical protein